MVQGCVTLGTPHLPPAPPGVDMTRGALSFVDANYPGAFLKDQGITYTTVAGVAVQYVWFGIVSHVDVSHGFVALMLIPFHY